MSTHWTQIIETLQRECLLAAAKLNSGASNEDLDSLERHLGVNLPASLRQFLSEYDGQADEATLGVYAGCQLLSTAGIKAQWDTWKRIDAVEMNADCADFMSSIPPGVVKAMYTNDRWIPLTHDWGGNHVGLDFDPDVKGKEGQVIQFGRDQDEKILVADSFDEFLPILISKVLEADWSFADKLREVSR